MRYLKGMAFLACVLGAVAIGCTSRSILNISSPVITGKKGPASEEEVLKAILVAGKVTNWSMEPQGRGLLVATRERGDHRASVNVGYSADRYSITFRETSMQPRVEGGRLPGGAGTPGGAPAGPPPDPGTVHRTYNLWVQELDRQIRANLLAIGP